MGNRDLEVLEKKIRRIPKERKLKNGDWENGEFKKFGEWEFENRDEKNGVWETGNESIRVKQKN